LLGKAEEASWNEMKNNRNDGLTIANDPVRYALAGQPTATFAIPPMAEKQLLISTKEINETNVLCGT
jgi:hypothetical protein